MQDDNNNNNNNKTLICVSQLWVIKKLVLVIVNLASYTCKV